MTEDIFTGDYPKRHFREMGTELGSVYDVLRDDVVRIHMKWNQYRQLYARSPERIELLNQAAGHLFGLIQEVLLEDVVMHLARLSDSERTGRKENLSLQSLHALILDKQLASEIDALAKIALTACDFTRVWRNLRLAHRDRALSLASSADPLPGISRAMIEEALASIRAVLNQLSRHYIGSETNYQLVIAYGRDADSLVYHLRLGLRAEEKRSERLENGEFLPEDFEHQIEV
jgi:AbiU2